MHINCVHKVNPPKKVTYEKRKENWKISSIFCVEVVEFLTFDVYQCVSDMPLANCPDIPRLLRELYVLALMTQFFPQCFLFALLYILTLPYACSNLLLLMEGYCIR